MRTLSEEQLAFLDNRLAEHLQLQPEFATLVERLLAISGIRVVAPPMPESDLTAILDRGREWDASSRLVRGMPSRCHQNVALLYTTNPRHLQIVTGYALSEDGLWRQHSWLHDASPRRRKRTIETTECRIRYFGVALDPEESRAFVAGNC